MKCLPTCSSTSICCPTDANRGTEDLGGGLKANFNLESDVNMGTGANNPASMFRRSAYVSLASDHYGELAGTRWTKGTQ